jgi:hypothetical protein
MSVLLGNNYLAWFESATAGTFAALKGQGTYSESRSQPKIDTSSKDTTGYSTGAFGNIGYEGSLDLRVNLPDAVYTRLETVANAPGTAVGFQIRSKGAAGATGDAIFAASVYPSIASRTFNKDGTVDVKISIALAAAPTIDVLA